MEKIKEHFYIIILIFLLLLIISIGYYFLYALPNYNREKLNIEREKQNEELRIKKSMQDTEEEKQFMEKLEKLQNENKLDECLTKAQNNYINNWENSCKSYSNDMSDLYTY